MKEGYPPCFVGHEKNSGEKKGIPTQERELLPSMEVLILRGCLN